jgi:hypothetical protein
MAMPSALVANKADLKSELLKRRMKQTSLAHCPYYNFMKCPFPMR